MVMDGRRTYVYAVCGAASHIQTLHRSLEYLRARTRLPILVVTDSRRNEIAIGHGNVIEVATPGHFDNHQASIYLKTSLHRQVPAGPEYVYLDTDLLAVEADPDSIFAHKVGPVTFARDLMRLESRVATFSPNAVNCQCASEGLEACGHLAEAIERKLGVPVPNDWGHWNGGLFLFGPDSTEFLDMWHKLTMEIFNDPYWKTRDQGTLMATVWRLGLERQATLPLKYNFLVDNRNADLRFDRRLGYSLHPSIPLLRPEFLHLLQADLERPDWNLERDVEDVLQARMEARRAAGRGEGGELPRAACIAYSGFPMRHVLITGAAGFIGSHLVEELLRDGFRVTGVDNFDPFYPRSIKDRNLEAAREHPMFRLVECDIRDFVKLGAELTDDYECIIHLAAKAGVRPSIDDPVVYQEVNVGGTQNLLEFARRRGIPQFVFASSSSVYGVNPNVPWREDDAVLLPISPYAATKVAGELLGHVYSHLYGIRFLALRLFSVYGPRQRPDLAINKFTQLLLEGRPIPFFGDGSTRRDYTFVKDVVTGLRCAMEYRGGSYGVFNIGGGEPVTLRELLATLEAELGVAARLEVRPEQAGDVSQTYADTASAEEALGFRCQTSFVDGVRAFRQWQRGDVARS